MRSLSEMKVEELSALEQKLQDNASFADESMRQLIDHQKILADKRAELLNAKPGRRHKKKRVAINKDIDDAINNMLHLLQDDIKAFIQTERDKRKNQTPKYSDEFLGDLHGRINSMNEECDRQVKEAAKFISRVQDELKLRGEQAKVKSEEREEQKQKDLKVSKRLDDIEFKKLYSLKLRFWDWVRRVITFFSSNPENKALAWVNKKLDTIRATVVIPDDVVPAKSTNPFDVSSEKTQTESEEKSAEIDQTSEVDSTITGELETGDLEELLKDLEQMTGGKVDKSSSYKEIQSPWTLSESQIPPVKPKNKLSGEKQQPLKPEYYEGEESVESFDSQGNPIEVDVEEFHVEEENYDSKGKADMVDDSSELSDVEEETTESTTSLASEEVDEESMVVVEEESEHDKDKRAARTLAERKDQLSALGKGKKDLREEAKKQSGEVKKK